MPKKDPLRRIEQRPKRLKPGENGDGTGGYDHYLRDHIDTPFDPEPLAWDLVTYYLPSSRSEGRWINQPLAETAKLVLELTNLKNVNAPNPGDRYLLAYDLASGLWVAVAASELGAGSPHAVHFSVPLPLTVNPPGPVNLTGQTLTIVASLFRSDGTVSGSLGVYGAFSTGAGRQNSLTISWADGASLDLSDELTTSGDPTYLSIDLAVQ